MNRRRLLGLAAAAIGMLLCAASAPGVLRRMDAFRVRSVEVTGTRFLKPHEALAAIHIEPGASVFDDPAPWRDSLLAHPLVAEVHIARRPPGTIVVDIDETDPVALIRTPTLRPVDVTGRVLPMDPAYGDLDLPVLGGAPKIEERRIRDERVLRSLHGLEEMRALQPALWPWVSELHAGRDHMRLVLRWPENAELLLRLPVDSAQLEEVRLVIADLAASDAAEDGVAAGADASDLARLRRLDARFSEQILVTLDGGKKPNSRERS